MVGHVKMLGIAIHFEVFGGYKLLILHNLTKQLAQIQK